MARDAALERRLAELDETERFHLQKLLERLQGRTLSPKEVGETLPEAVLVGDGASLSRSMVEITEQAIDYSIRKDPATLSTALFPIIGSAIRKALNKMLSEMMEGMNGALESALSMKRLRWRAEARRTGVPFVEIVLRETLRYRVEHAFLIDGKSGVLIRGVSLDGARAADSDMVAGMLTAVRDFIKDSLELKRSEDVNAIMSGDHAIMVEEGPRATLALIVKGTPDSSLRTLMEETLEAVHLRFAAPLERYSGDSSALEGADRYLKACLASKDKREPGAKPVYAIVAVAALAAVVAGLAALGVADASRRRAFEEALSAEPGMMVASSRRAFGTTRMRVLRDPRARAIESVASSSGVDLARFELEVEEFSSAAFSAGAIGRTIPGELLELARRLSSYTVLFEQDSGELRAGQEKAMREAGALVSELVSRARALDFAARVEITGHAAGDAQDDRAVRVSEERAKKALDAFVGINAPLADFVSARGVGILEPVVPDATTEADAVLNRSVTFKAIVR